jgi:hypothetical protein
MRSNTLELTGLMILSWLGLIGILYLIESYFVPITASGTTFTNIVYTQIVKLVLSGGLIISWFYGWYILIQTFYQRQVSKNDNSVL